MRVGTLGGVVLCALVACSSGKDESVDNTMSGSDGPGGEPAASGADDSSADSPRDGEDPAPGDAGTVVGDTGGGDPAAGGSGGSRPTSPPTDNDASPDVQCAQRPVEGPPDVRFHHVHFNTTDPDADLAFFETFRDSPVVDFCADEDADHVTRATRTERGWFLYHPVKEAPDDTLNTYLEHVGWIHPSPGEELARLVELGVTLYPEGRNQCPEAAAGTMACPVGQVLTNYFFYLQAPSGARIEIARGPGPAESGFGHVHLIQGVDLNFFATVSDGAYVDGAIDFVNHTDVSLTEDMLMGYDIVDTRGKPIDHIAYSTTDLEAARDRIEAAGITIEEDIAERPLYGFRSFFVRSPKGIWVEMVEDSPFEP